MDIGILSFVAFVVFLSAMSALGIWLRFSANRRPRNRRQVGPG